MKKIFTILALTVLFAGGANAQTKSGKISGLITDSNKKGIESATISLLKASDSSVIKLSVANKGGTFEFDQAPAGKYLISVTAVGHQKKYSEVIELSEGKGEAVVQTIQMIPQAKGMDGVTVTASRPFIEQKIDRTVVNVEAAVTNAGSTALEVLEKSPGVSVDKDGNISLKGKQGVMVMMDGRPSYLSATELS
ncbi:MAG TPA: carboxypeptidase-like regulatory domain-containing protein, partial [Chitinophagaceae bacterium]|nr:carboxypeptidase-like regulatory domain-containing protein [Chitinophagaceae bacterium]